MSSPNRGIANAFHEAVANSDAILPFPLQHAATTPLRSAAAAKGPRGSWRSGRVRRPRCPEGSRRRS